MAAAIPAGTLGLPCLLLAKWILAVHTSPQTLFYVDDLIAQHGAESKLWMLQGEDASLGTRQIQYYDETYCSEVLGTLNPSICRPSFLINGWNKSDGSSVASRTHIGTALDPAGEGDGEHIIGPAVDTVNRRVFFVTQSCYNGAASRRLAAKIWKVKVLLDNQIVPEASEARPLSCANESYVFAVNRYDVDTGKYSLLYAQVRADFPAPSKFDARSWKLAFDVQRQRLYWWYNAGGCAVVQTCPAPLYYIDVSGLEDGGAPPTPVLATTVTDGYGHWYWDLALDSQGNAIMMDWYKIRRWNVGTGTLETLWTEDYLGTGWHFTGIAIWGARILVAKTSISTSQIWVFDPAAAPGSQWSELYRQIRYEFSDLGMNVYNMAVDEGHGVFYVAMSGGNSGARSVLELPLQPPAWSTAPHTACLYGWQLDCPLYAKGERLVVGHMPSAFNVVGDGKSTNFAPGTADRFPADGTSQLALLPAAAGVAYPARNPCAGRSSPAGLDALSARLKATARTRCGKATSTGYDTRHLLYGVDAATGPSPNYLLRDYVSLDGLRTGSSGSFGYDKVGERRAYYNFIEIATGGGNDASFPGLKAESGYGHAIKGPAVDHIHGFVYWMSCEKALLPRQCSEWALKRVAISVLEEAAKVQGVDCSKSRCPKTGDDTVLQKRHWVVANKTETLYRQSTQFFPGPDDTRTQTTKLAVDPEAEIVYWMTSALSLGTPVLAYIDVRGWSASKPRFEPCDVGIVATHYENGAWTSLQVMCDGSLLSHEIDALKVLDFANDAHVSACRASAAEWAALPAEARPGFKGCWQRLFGEDGLGCVASAGTGGCAMKAIAYDFKRDQIYYAFRYDGRREAIARFNRTRGPGGRDPSTGKLRDEVVYSGIFYEWPPVSYKGSQFIAGLAVDDVNDELYVASYYGNSALQSVAVMPLPENPSYPGANRDVHAAYWPMDLVNDTDPPIACLYGHESIPHSSGYDNRACEYQGERTPTKWRSTGFRVVLPDQEGIRRFYITETSGSMAVLPARANVMLHRRQAIFDWSTFFTMLPHAGMKLSKTNGWSYQNLPITATDLGWTPSYSNCAELCATFWRSGSKRCIGFDWYMSNIDCEDLKRAGKLPNHTTKCAYSNSGLACLFSLVTLDDTKADSFTAWPNPCFTWPTTDRDGSPWLSGVKGKAPAGGWPASVEDGRFLQYGARTVHFELDRRLLAATAEGQALRDRWREQVPRGAYYGISRPKWPGDLHPYIFNSRDPSPNPAEMPSEVASCFPQDRLVRATGDPTTTTTTSAVQPPITSTAASTPVSSTAIVGGTSKVSGAVTSTTTTLGSSSTTGPAQSSGSPSSGATTTPAGPSSVQIDMTLDMDYAALTSNETLVASFKEGVVAAVKSSLPEGFAGEINVELSKGSVKVKVTVVPAAGDEAPETISSSLESQGASLGQAVVQRVQAVPGIEAATGGGSISLVGAVGVSVAQPKKAVQPVIPGVANAGMALCLPWPLLLLLWTLANR